MFKVLLIPHLYMFINFNSMKLKIYYICFRVLKTFFQFLLHNKILIILLLVFLIMISLQILLNIPFLIMIF